ncbi:endonuclease/exonuclease/phosphatase family protein [Williamsia herbipolensis]|uniref:endonuclease/exonuclease/phosphatase family protein n=1 Tax=Williamsia herbipolensis TaxID=1603258 RepID=UPI0006990162|nr:endonuclease/exonuclease/phosphatase family protein [Williamsia herbipolensis]
MVRTVARERGPLARTATVVAALVGWALAAAVVMALWLHWYPGRGRVSTALASAVPWLLLAAVPALLLLGLTRRWISVALTLLLAVAGLTTQLPLLVASTAPAGRDVVVVQSNIKLGAGDVGEVVDIVSRERADLLTIEELTPQALTRLQATDLRTTLPYLYAVPGTGGVGTAIASRYPLRDTIALDGYSLNNLRAVVDLPGAPATTVFAVHPIPPYPYAPDRWVREMRTLRETVHGTRGDHVIVSGDLNSTWDHQQFRALADNGFGDATDQAGARWAMTYPADRWFPPVIAIDHVVSHGFIARSLHTVSVSGSDHRALVVRLAVN